MAKWCIPLGAVLLAAGPARWLVSSWFDPAYASHGALVFALVVALVVWSVRSGPARPDARARRLALRGLWLSSALRLAGQLLGVHLLSAATLVVDVGALALLARLHVRPRAIAPEWLALLFAASLPLERALQRLSGYGLQRVSASGACSVLEVGGWSPQCEGVRIVLAGQDVMVDLPCAGTRGLLLTAIGFAVLACVRRPRWPRAIEGLAVALAGATLSNCLRISALAVGIVRADALGIDVMREPWHGAIGLCFQVLSLAGVALWFRYRVRRPGEALEGRPLLRPGFEPASPTKVLAPWQALSFVLASVAIVGIEARPIDVARTSDAPTLPAAIGRWPARAQPLTPRERDYFAQYGGGAARALYGPHALLMVRTSAPLRHLHDPQTCLSGAGHDVEFLGTEHGRVPTAVYRSVDPGGRAFRVRVSYRSDSGRVATSVAEVVWRWLEQPSDAWTMIQRISPEHSDANFDHGVESLVLDLAIQGA